MAARIRDGPIPAPTDPPIGRTSVRTTIQVNYVAGSTILVNGRSYELKQFHFHEPSEEHVRGKGFPMVAHLVHQDSRGELAVIAVLLDVGRPNPFLGTIWKELPVDTNVEKVVAEVSINIADLLPASRGYYTFAGSLTTPPCSENVTWFVLKTPVEISAKQVSLFGKRYPDDARPVQPINDRVVRETSD